MEVAANLIIRSKDAIVEHRSKKNELRQSRLSQSDVGEIKREQSGILL